MRFHKLRRYQTKFFFVAPNERRKEYEDIIKTLPRGIKGGRCKFIAYTDLEALYNSMSFCEQITHILGEKWLSRNHVIIVMLVNLCML
jgi:hypothetical protein